VIRVLLADDHALVRDGLQALLTAGGEIEVVGVAADGVGAVRSAQQLRPDVIVMDVGMPGLGGIDATRRICERDPAAKVLMLSMHGNSEHIHQAFRAGARGYLLKESAGAEVVVAVLAVHAGRRYLSQKITEIAVDHFVLDGSGKGPLDKLSDREREVLKSVVDGHSNAETARLLCLSVKSVEAYRSRLMQKLGIDNLASLVKFAIEHGLTTLE